MSHCAARCRYHSVRSPEADDGWAKTADGDRIRARHATLFAARGAAVAILDRDEPSARTIAGAIGGDGGRAAAIRCDVSDPASYGMTKGAVLTMTKSIALDYVKHGIRCNCICPARVHTPFVDGYLAANYPGREAEMYRKLSEYQPIGRMGRPEEVAALALYLCSDEASFITGQAYPIDGGVLMA